MLLEKRTSNSEGNFWSTCVQKLRTSALSGSDNTLAKLNYPSVDRPAASWALIGWWDGQRSVREVGRLPGRLAWRQRAAAAAPS